MQSKSITSGLFAACAHLLGGGVSASGQSIVTEIMDASGDGFVELKEFAQMSWCLTGPDSAPGNRGEEPNEPIVSHPGCAIQDLDADGDIDLLDLALFANDFTGAP